jgi:5,6,7,8-tetrahydromethanopterin hydro-lyase
LSAILIGEGFAGEGPNAAHVNTVLGLRDGPVGTAWATALATPRAGHASFVVVARPNMPVKPPTLFVNKAEIRGDSHGFLHWGAAQAALARGVLESVAAGTIPQGEVDELALIAAVWVDWAASDEEEVYANNVRATKGALASAAEGRPRLDELIAIASEPSNPFFRST